MFLEQGRICRYTPTLGYTPTLILGYTPTPTLGYTEKPAPGVEPL